MSYDLAVWEGDRPDDDTAAGEEFERLYERYMETDDEVAPAPRIAAYAEALTTRYPGTGDESPWSGDLIDCAQGPLLYFDMTWSRGPGVAEQAARVAGEHGLNCFDPQSEQLLTPAGKPWRFELTSACSGRVREPDADRIRRAVERLSADHYYAVLERADGWYVQAGYGEQAGTRVGWYAVERRDGSPDRHFRAVLTDIDEVKLALVGFLEGDPSLERRLPWQPYTV